MVEIWPGLLNLSELSEVDVDTLKSFARVPGKSSGSVLDCQDSGDVDGGSNETINNVSNVITKVNGVGSGQPVVERRGCRPRRLSVEALARAVERYESGEILRVIAADYGISRGFLTKQLVAAGVGIRNRRLSEGDIREAIFRYGAGESVATIGKALGFNAKAIWLVLRAACVPMRDTHGRVVQGRVASGSIA